MRTRVKFCGMTELDDALAAVAAGADALGFVFVAASPRYIEPKAAAAIARHLPPFVAKVGLFVDEDPAIIATTVRIAGIDTLQLHGNETPEVCADIHRTSGLPYIKSFAVRPGCNLGAACAAYSDAAALLFDAYDPRRAGGTGTVFDWNSIPRDLRLPIILAGGLHAGNIAAAINAVRPYAVDVSSGIELHPGRKDRDKMQRFMHEVFRVD